MRFRNDILCAKCFQLNQQSTTQGQNKARGALAGSFTLALHAGVASTGRERTAAAHDYSGGTLRESEPNMKWFSESRDAFSGEFLLRPSITTTHVDQLGSPFLPLVIDSGQPLHVRDRSMALAVKVLYSIA
jgi:hypothetical protein